MKSFISTKVENYLINHSQQIIKESPDGNEREEDERFLEDTERLHFNIMHPSQADTKLTAYELQIPQKKREKIFN